MKILVHRLCSLALLLLLSFIAFDAPAVAQNQIADPSARPPDLLEKSRAKKKNTSPGASTTAASGYNFQVLYSFGATTTDGTAPMASLTEDTAGNLCGTTLFGGAHGAGTVFKLDSTGQETVLDGEDGEISATHPNHFLAAINSRRHSWRCQRRSRAHGHGDVGQQQLYFSVDDACQRRRDDQRPRRVSAFWHRHANSLLLGGHHLPIGNRHSHGQGRAHQLHDRRRGRHGCAGRDTGNTSTITVTPSGGFTGSVAVTAVITSKPSGAQDLPTLSFGETSPVAIATASAGTATLIVTTMAATSAALVRPARSRGRGPHPGAATLAFALLIGMGIRIPLRGRGWWTRLATLVLMAALSGAFVACSSNGGGGTNTGIPAPLLALIRRP